MLDPRDAEEIPGDLDPALRGEVAHTTANALVHGGRAAEDPEVVDRLVRLVEAEGLDTVAGLWADSAPHTLPGALWRLYALREWVRRDPRTVAERYRLGEQRAEVHGAVAGVAAPPGPEEVAHVADAVLSGVYTGDLAVALERAGAFCRVLATGAVLDADVVADDEEARQLTRGAAGLVRTAEELEECAGLWRAGTLD
ncbi:hypothetical protein OEB99_11250 [Actinotalea sp. M2MS4P-6]|uniref:hypothetical protein n=1 Tax=Actinotalea sp. M2MS4P-6 TaxID=2983762 RepID=UPI0021E3D04C|nr:hypothetical protein [Actinotalea sp. M2MS4P-6]MCV2394887.1 hypothetical protein [Actinotalea sp. M2MS4P-6]